MGRSATVMRWGLGVAALVVAGGVVATALLHDGTGAPAPIVVAAGSDVAAPAGGLREIEPTRVLPLDTGATADGTEGGGTAGAAGSDGSSPGAGAVDDPRDPPTLEPGPLVPGVGTVTVPTVPGTIPTTVPDLPGGLLPDLPVLGTTTTTLPPLPLPLPPLLPLPVP